MITEQQYKNLLLNEKMHYPEFLDKFKEYVSLNVYNKMQNELKSNNLSFEFVLKTNCDYTDEIIFNVTLNPYRDIKDKHDYQCYYYNEYNNLFKGKLYQPKITIVCPVHIKQILFSILKTLLSHELTHLYDDWSELSRGNTSINYTSKNIDTTRFVGDSLRNGEELYKNISMMGYMSSKFEKQAFLSQTVQELQEIGCTLHNYKEKIKNTSIYNNIHKSYINGIGNIKKATSFQLKNCNEYILILYPKANVPKMNLGTFDAEKYRNKLLSWMDKSYHNIMKYYGSIIQYYLDKLQEEKDKTTSMFIL